MELRNRSRDRLYYWTSRGKAEVEYIIEDNKNSYLLEVKSGTNRTLKSLRRYEGKYHPIKIIRTSHEIITKIKNL